MDSLRNITVQPPPTLEALVLTTRMQLTAAIFTRMNFMLRCVVESSQAFIPALERGNFCEYCQWLFHLSYTFTVGGVVEYDMMMLQSRKDGEWKSFGLPPTRITNMNWPKLVVPVCAFCEVRLPPRPQRRDEAGNSQPPFSSHSQDTGHVFDQCSLREAHMDIPRLLRRADKGPVSEKTNQELCRDFNRATGCSKSPCRYREYPQLTCLPTQPRLSARQ